MSELNKLHNTGISYVGNEEAIKAKKKTLVVVGIARGGTSLVAGVLQHLGIYMGALANEPVFEDVYLATPMENGNLQRVKEVISQYNDKYATWGFKRPSIINDLEQMHTKFTNPIYLFVFKDIFSVANRNSVSMKTDLLRGIHSAYHDYGKVLDFIDTHDVNGYLFSYEKTMCYKERFVNTLVNIIGNEHVTEKQKERALSFISPNSQSYLQSSHINSGKGAIDKVEKTFVSGWARYMNDEREVMVDLYVNEKKIATTKANKFRQDLFNRKVHTRGECAYVFTLTNENYLQKDDKINVKISDEVVFLRELPRVFLGVIPQPE